jgi:hypothetical protein
LKSLVRRTLFDRRLWAGFEAELGRRGFALRMPADRFLVSDAALSPIEPASLDLVYSEDVFEHIALSSLKALLPRLATWLKPGGLALIRPNVFTGITGGHLVEWNRRSFAVGAGERGSDAWDHLRQQQFSANTHLNRLTRADYRALFRAHFEILDEQVKLPDLGREFLTPGVARELADYPEEELFSNQVLFTLRPKPLKA